MAEIPILAGSAQQGWTHVMRRNVSATFPIGAARRGKARKADAAQRRDQLEFRQGLLSLPKSYIRQAGLCSRVVSRDAMTGRNGKLLNVKFDFWYTCATAPTHCLRKPAGAGS